MAEKLRKLLAECRSCHALFVDNVALLLDGEGSLTDDQMRAILIELSARHRQHVH